MTPKQIAEHTGPWTYELWVKTVFADLVRHDASSDADMFEPIARRLFELHVAPRSSDIDRWLTTKCFTARGGRPEPEGWAPHRRELFQRLMARAGAAKAWHKRDRQLRRK